MSDMTDVLMAHQYRHADRCCSCEDIWYDLRGTHDRDKVEHARHVEKELMDAGFGPVREARAEALEAAADALSQPRTLWFGDQGVTVADPPGLPTATLDEWLRARAVAERGRQ